MIFSLLKGRLYYVAKSQFYGRLFATDAASVAVTKPVVRNTGGGMFGGLFQRITSFFVGAGLTALGTHYLILEELRKSNAHMIEKQKEMESRLFKLEKK